MVSQHMSLMSMHVVWHILTGSPKSSTGHVPDAWILMDMHSLARDLHIAVCVSFEIKE